MSKKANGNTLVRGHPELVQAQQKHYDLEARLNEAQAEYSTIAERERTGGTTTDAVALLLAGKEPDYASGDLAAASRKVRALGAAVAQAKRDAETVKNRLVEQASKATLPTYKSLVDKVYSAAVALVAASAEAEDYSNELAQAGLTNPYGWGRATPHYTPKDLEDFKERIFRNVARHVVEGGGA